MTYSPPGAEGSVVRYAEQYDNFIGGEWTPPVEGRYFDDHSPVDGRIFTRVPRSSAADVELALDAAHTATDRWGSASSAERAGILNRIANRMEANLERLAAAESWENGKPIRETLAADLPLAIDHFRYFAGAIRAQEGGIGQIDEDTVAYHFHEPLGVIGQIVPWDFPLLAAAWKLAPALAAGNAVVLEPAEQTPVSVLLLVELIADLLPPGVLNVVNGFGTEIHRPLAASPRIARLAFTGEAATGRLIMRYAAQNTTPVTLELGGKSPNIFMPDVTAADDGFLDKAIEGFTMFALNQGEVRACPSRALVHSSIHDEFMERALERVRAIVSGDPLDPATQIGAQVSRDRYEKVLAHFALGRAEGAEVLAGGGPRTVPGLEGGYYVEPTVFRGTNDMRVFQEEIFGPAVSVTTFDSPDEALKIANGTPYEPGAGIWTRDGNTAYRMGRAIRAGRVWTNCYHLYPAHAAFGGHRQQGISRENHKAMLDHYQQTKNMLVSYSDEKLGFF